MDEDLALQSIEREKELEKQGVRLPSRVSGPDLAEYSLIVERLTDIADILNALHGSFIYSKSKKGSKKPTVKPLPRPITARQIVSRQMSEDTLREIEEMVLPWKKKQRKDGDSS